MINENQDMENKGEDVEIILEKVGDSVGSSDGSEDNGSNDESDNIIS